MGHTIVHGEMPLSSSNKNLSSSCEHGVSPEIFLQLNSIWQYNYKCRKGFYCFFSFFFFFYCAYVLYRNLITQNRKQACVIAMTNTPLPSSGAARDCAQSEHMETSFTPAGGVKMLFTLICVWKIIRSNKIRSVGIEHFDKTFL